MYPHSRQRSAAAVSGPQQLSAVRSRENAWSSTGIVKCQVAGCCRSVDTDRDVSLIGCCRSVDTDRDLV